MASSKPTSVPLFNTSGTNNVAPPPAKVSTGWVFSEAPPSSYLNNQQKLYGEWHRFLNERMSEGAVTENTALHNADSKSTRVELVGQGTTKQAATAVTTAFVANNVVVASGALFVTNAVAIDDIVSIVGSTSNSGFYRVASIVGETSITVKNSVSGAAVVFVAEPAAGTVAVFAPGQMELDAPRVHLKRYDENNAVRLGSPSGLASSYDWTFPTGLPSVTRFLSLSATGQVAASSDSILTSTRIVTVGDGTTSFGQFNGADETPFNSAIAALSGGLGVVLVGPGTYALTTTLTIPGGVELIGYSRNRTFINGASEPLIRINGDRARLHGIRFFNTAGNTVVLAQPLSSPGTCDRLMLSECRFQWPVTATSSAQMVVLAISQTTGTSSVNKACIFGNDFDFTGRNEAKDVFRIVASGGTAGTAEFKDFLMQGNTFTNNTSGSTGAAGTSCVKVQMLSNAGVTCETSGMSFIGNHLTSRFQVDRFISHEVSASATGTARIDDNVFVGNSIQEGGASFVAGGTPLSLVKLVGGGTESISDNIFLGNRIGDDDWVRTSVTTTDNKPYGADASVTGGGATMYVSSSTPVFTAQIISDSFWNR